MSTRKSKPRTSSSQPQQPRYAYQHNHQQQPRQSPAQPISQPTAAAATAAQFSDYDTDAANGTDANLAFSQPTTPRTNESLNLAVLRREHPDITSIRFIAPYAVLYTFSPQSAGWEKSNVEGTLFICEETAHPIYGSSRFSVSILNRRALEGFYCELKSAEDVEVGGEFLILRTNGATVEQQQDGAGAGASGETDEDGAAEVVGLWVFSEEGMSTEGLRDVVAALVEECARTAQEEREAAEQRLLAQAGEEAEADAADADEVPGAVPMGRQVSLRELFGQQREADADFSVHQHHQPAAPQQQQYYHPQHPPTQPLSSYQNPAYPPQPPPHAYPPSQAAFQQQPQRYQQHQQPQHPPQPTGPSLLETFFRNTPINATTTNTTSAPPPAAPHTTHIPPTTSTSTTAAPSAVPVSTQQPSAPPPQPPQPQFRSTPDTDFFMGPPRFAKLGTGGAAKEAGKGGVLQVPAQGQAQAQNQQQVQQQHQRSMLDLLRGGAGGGV